MGYKPSSAAPANYNSGAQAVYVRGDKFTDNLYYGGSSRTFHKRGNAYDDTLYSSAGSVTVRKQGSRYGGTLYMKSGSNYYQIGFDLYYGGGSETYELRGGAISDSLYYDGGSETVTLQGSPCTEDLYTQGPYYSKGLFHTYVPSECHHAKLIREIVNTTQVTALTTQ